MNGQEFIGTVTAYFSGFLKQLGFADGSGKYSGRFYDVQFDHPQYVLSVSYEPCDDYLLIVLFTRSDGELSGFDDSTKTLRLSDLNARFMPLVTSDERSENTAYFSEVIATTSLEKQLLKSARELRLCLQKLLT